jgi:hypothetical protein
MSVKTSTENELAKWTMRRALVVGLGLALVLGVLAAGLEVVPSSRSSGPTYLAPLPSFAAVSRDGRTLTTFPVYGPCGDGMRQRLLAVESGQLVSLTLLVHGRQYTEAQLRQMPCALAFVSNVSPPSVTLGAPLGSRVVVQGLTGRSIPVYGGEQIATPTVLPRGCAPGPIQPISDIITAGPPYPTGSHPGLTWSCDVAVPFPPRYAFTPASQLQFGQWQGWIRSLDIPIEVHTTVHGLPALVKVRRVNAFNIIQQRSISWHEDGQTFVITSSSGLSQTVAHSKAVLSAAELVRIADGVKVSNSSTPAGN